VKLTNLTITPKLGILVGVTLLGLCAGVLAGHLMQREMGGQSEACSPFERLAKG
jgi:hypothetical protein